MSVLTFWVPKSEKDWAWADYGVTAVIPDRRHLLEVPGEYWDVKLPAGEIETLDDDWQVGLVIMKKTFFQRVEELSTFVQMKNLQRIELPNGEYLYASAYLYKEPYYAGSTGTGLISYHADRAAQKHLRSTVATMIDNALKDEHRWRNKNLDILALKNMGDMYSYALPDAEMQGAAMNYAQFGRSDSEKETLPEEVKAYIEQHGWVQECVEWRCTHYVTPVNEAFQSRPPYVETNPFWRALGSKVMSRVAYGLAATAGVLELAVFAEKLFRH